MVDCLPQKEDPNCNRLTVRVNLIGYPGYVSTPTSDTTTAKIVWNSMFSTPKANYMYIEINIFYLGTPLTRYNYLHISITFITDEIIQQYILLPIGRNGFIYLEICKSVYGLPQAGRLANVLLTERLAPKGYFQFTHTPVIWRQKWRPILFSLVVDDLSVNYVGKEHSYQ